MPVTIEDDVWIAGDVVINPGVTIGEGSVIGSGSVVTKSIPKNVVALGNPCSVHREITEKDKNDWEAMYEAYQASIE
ncbi:MULTISPECIES: DapH/DapD/GlmU-related protein [Oceanobacillus]|uniref:DapH/DapD/GlmU-related protein n=1 Tax=Oceanobacillus aidingensis TaxID=645964 RepID=A0ABV9JXL0_9BACI|nr:DapH/DapD/GlmU-related protein [Oceanobacillus oncorhynchi]MDM8101703.1 DapH/DapD/GlmU-related protein [Oceanobacillus oncorhynchi]